MFYNYLFYFFYKLILKTPSSKDVVFMTIIAMVLPVGVNLILVKELIEYFLKIEIYFSEIGLGSFAVLLMGLNYFLFMYKNKYQFILERIKEISNKKKWENIVLLYLIITLVLFFCVPYLALLQYLAVSYRSV